MSVINLKALFNDLKSIPKYDITVSSTCSSWKPHYNNLNVDKWDSGEWIKVSDLQKILDEYGDDASLKD